MEVEREKPSAGNIVAKWKSLKKNISVEPLILLMIVAGALSIVSVQTLNLEKACRSNANLSEETCQNFLKNPNFDNTTKSTIAPIVIDITTWSNIVQVTIPSIMVLFVGSWSDRTGLRKPCMIIPILGYILVDVGLLLCVFFFEEWPAQIAGVFESVPVALTGGKAILLLGIYSYLADHTTEEERTFRIGLLNIVTTISGPIGTALSGKLRKTIGYYGIFGTCLTLYVIALIYTILKLKDKNPNKETTGTGKKIKAFFDISNLVSCYHMLVKKRPLNKRKMILMLVAAYFVSIGPGSACDDYIYYYSRDKYNMDEVEFSVYFSYVIALNFIGVSMGMLIMHKCLKFSDALMGSVAFTFRFISVFIYSFGPTKKWFYVAPVIEMLGAVAIIALQSMLSKLVLNNELGKINSVLTLSSAIGQVITQPIFGEVYKKAKNNFAGMHINVYGIFLFVTTILFIFTYKADRKAKKQDPGIEIDKKEEQDDDKERYAYDNEVTSF